MTGELRTQYKPFLDVSTADTGGVRVAVRQGPRARVDMAATREPMAFHRKLDGYRETPLREIPAVAAQLGLKRLLVKDETSRLRLPSFKVLGASWAVYRLLRERLSYAMPDDASFKEVRDAFSTLGPLTLVTATDGNHGRALARVGRLFGLNAHVLVPVGTASARIEAIRTEGASVEVVNGTYDDAVLIASALASETVLVVADTGWDGYERIPTWISDGYSTILWEIHDALQRGEEPLPELVVVQVGVGALMRAVVAYFRQLPMAAQPLIVGVEPETAACAFATAAAGELTEVPGPHRSAMAGLNCGRISTVALPALLGGVDAFVAIPDDAALTAVRALAREGIAAGETGAAGLAGLFALPETIWRRFGQRPERALLIITEGITDRASYEEILAQPAS